MIWLLACAAPTPQSDDAEAFARGACSEVRSVDLQAECQYSTASCPDLPAGRWRDECWFAKGEAQLESSPAQAIASCSQAGAFAGECWTHLFKSQTDPAHGGTLEDALAIEATYPTATWRPPWGWWWRRHHEAAAVIAPDTCAQLERNDLRRPCQRSAPTVLALAWRRLLRDRPRVWCSRELQDLSTDPYGKPWARSVRLDAIVTKELGVCAP